MMDLEQRPPTYAGSVADGEAPALPAQPKSLRDTGLPQQLLVELLAKSLFLGGRSHLPALTAQLRLSLNVLREVLGFMVAEQLAEVAWRGASDIDVQYQLTAAGKQRAALYLERCAYLGPAPVTLDAYQAMVRRQSWRGGGAAALCGADLDAVIGGDHLDGALREQLGAALYSGRALLLYGPSGSGKSRLAGKFGQLLQGMVAVPYAVLAGQEIVTLHDPLLHRAPDARQALQARQLLERRSSDIRWQLCQRPLLQVGAELCADMLALQYDAHGGCYQAPPHLKANNGVFIVDDLGRQRLPAADVLNRLLPLLDQGQDQLTLRGGHQFSVPSDLLLVCITGQAPHCLLDAASLRRLPYKIGIGALAEPAYRALLREQCLGAGVQWDESGLRHLLAQLHGASGEPLLASYPVELCARIVDFAGFAGRAPRLTVAALEQAWASMFACQAPGLAGSAPREPA